MARIIVGALIASLVFFFIVITIAGVDLANLKFGLSLDQIITVLAVGYAVVGIVVSQVITKFIYKKTTMVGESPTDEEVEASQMQYQNELIIRSALLEGAAFFCGIAFMIDNNIFALVGAATCLFFLVLKFPQESAHLYDIQRRLTDHT